MKRSFRLWAACGGGAFLFVTAALSAFAQPAPPPGGPPSGGPPSIDAPGGPPILPRDVQRPPSPGEAPGGGRPNADPVAMMLNNSALQAELKIQPDQLEHLKSIAREFQLRQYELLLQLKEGPEKARAARAALAAHMEMGRAMIARVLNRRQLDRLQQIMMQVGGYCLAVHDENVTLALSIDPSQMRRIATACQKMQLAEEPVPTDAGPKEACAAMKRAQASYEAVRGQVEAEVATILSEGQIASLRAMEGEPFAMAPPTPPECM